MLPFRHYILILDTLAPRSHSSELQIDYSTCLLSHVRSIHSENNKLNPTRYPFGLRGRRAMPTATTTPPKSSRRPSNAAASSTRPSLAHRTPTCSSITLPELDSQELESIYRGSAMQPGRAPEYPPSPFLAPFAGLVPQRNAGVDAVPPEPAAIPPPVPPESTQARPLNDLACNVHVRSTSNGRVLDPRVRAREVQATKPSAQGSLEHQRKPSLKRKSQTGTEEGGVARVEFKNAPDVATKRARVGDDSRKSPRSG